MKEILLKEKTPLIVLFVVFFMTFIFSFQTQGQIFSNGANEASVPFLMANGKILYKEIYTQTGALVNIFLMVLMKIFGSNSNLLYVFGAIVSVFYIFGTYFVSREFLSKKLSLSLCFLVTFASVFSPSEFNFIFPSSYSATLCATLCLWLIYFLISFIKNQNEKTVLVLGALSGLILACDPAFSPILILPIIIFAIFKVQAEFYLKFIALAASIPLLALILLLFGGTNIADIIENFKYFIKISKTNANWHYTLKYSIYKPNFVLIFHMVLNFLAFLLYAALFFFGIFYVEKKNLPHKKAIIGVISIAFLYFTSIRQIQFSQFFNFLPIFCLFVLVRVLKNYILAKKFKDETQLKQLVLASSGLLISTKCFWHLDLAMFGTYYFAPLILTFTCYLNSYLESKFVYNSKKEIKNALLIFISAFVLIFFITVFMSVSDKKIKIKTDNFSGKISTEQSATKELMDYLSRHSTKDEDIISMPNGAGINFALGKNLKFKNTYFTPDVFEALGDDNLALELSDNAPKYIVITNENMEDFNRGIICTTYAKDFCKTVVSKYALEAAFGDNFRIYLFKLKEGKHFEK